MRGRSLDLDPRFLAPGLAQASQHLAQRAERFPSSTSSC
jgi:hypothetical protein